MWRHEHGQVIEEGRFQTDHEHAVAGRSVVMMRVACCVRLMFHSSYLMRAPNKSGENAAWVRALAF